MIFDQFDLYLLETKKLMKICMHKTSTYIRNPSYCERVRKDMHLFSQCVKKDQLAKNTELD